MKKLLLGTTALVAASFTATAAVAAPEIKLGGYMDFQAGFSSQETDGWSSAPGVPKVDNERGFSWRTDTELLLTVSDKLDNGLAWKVKIELEADADGITQTVNNNGDEVSIVFSGSWGQLTLGNEDGPVDLNKFGNAQLSGLGVSGATGYTGYTDVKSFSNGLPTKGVDLKNSGDNTKILYYTPVINGFQAGVSYTISDQDNGRSRGGDLGGSGVSAFENYWEVGAAYDMKVNSDLKLGVSVVATTAKALNNDTGGQTSNTAIDDIKAYALALSADYGNWKASIGYSSDGKSGQQKDIGNSSVDGYGAALKYADGPAEIGLSYMHGNAGANTGQTASASAKVTKSATADYAMDTFTLGARYTLGAGLVVYADSWYYKNDSDGVYASSENTALGLLIGTKVTF